MDHYAPAGTSGRYETPRGVKARVIWSNARLYVFTNPYTDPAHVAVFDAPDHPTSSVQGSGRRTRTVWEAAGVEWEKGACGCNYPRQLKLGTQTVLVNAADAMVEAGTVTVQPLETADV